MRPKSKNNIWRVVPIFFIMGQFQKILNRITLPVFITFTILLPLLRSAPCENFQNQTTTNSGFLSVRGISINRINLALKEIDIEISILRIEANGPFNFSLWAPFRRGGSVLLGNGTPTEYPPWHEFVRSQWKWLRFISIESIGLYGLNTFPFEQYKTEIVFGISVRNITATSYDSYVSWELEQQGYWAIDAWVANTSYSKIAKLNATYALHIRKHKLHSFISLFIQLRHPEEYKWKMAIPTWGPIGFALTVLIAQFIFLRRKMKRSDHITMFVAVSIFSLGTSFVIREMSPPELTFPELASFVIAIVYSLLLFATIYSGSYKTNETENRSVRSLRSMELGEENKKRLALLFAGALIGFIKSILELSISVDVKVTLIITTVVGIAFFLLYGIGIPQEKYHEFILKHRWKEPLKIGILNDMKWDVSNREIFAWSDVSPDSWKEAIERFTNDLGVEVKVELIHAGMKFDSYVAILNPYGGVYPEYDLRNLSTLDKILGYVKEGGCFINVADIPSYWAYNPDLHRKLDIASTVYAALPTPTGVRIISTKPFELTPLIERLRLRIIRNDSGIQQNLDAVLGASVHTNIRSERLAIVESNVVSCVPTTRLPYVDGNTYDMSALFFVNFGDGAFLFSLIWINTAYHNQQAREAIKNAIVKLLVEKAASKTNG